MALRMTNNERDLLEIIDENFEIISNKIDFISKQLENLQEREQTNELIDRLKKAGELFEKLSQEKMTLISSIIEKYN